jgi:hypothetical protein
MHKRLSAVGAGIAAVAVVATSFLGGASANATVTPPYEPDAYSLGGLTLRDAAGAVVTSGSLAASPIAAYAVASGTTTDAGSHAFAHLQLATPNGTPNTYAYNTEPLGADSSYPVAAPASVAAAGANVPVASGTAGDLSFATYIGDFPNSQTGSYANLYQLRLYTPSTSSAVPSAKYFSVDLQVDPATSTWTVVYPAPAAVDDTTTTITSPVAGSSGATSTPVSLVAHVADVANASTVPTGSVTFKDGGSTLATVAVNGSGDATTTVPGSTLTIGAHAFTADYVPSSGFNASSTATATTYTASLPRPSNLVAPAAGAARVGVASSCDPGAWYYAGSYAYAWYLDSATVPFATSRATPPMRAAYVGHTVSCRVTVSNPGNSPVTAASAKVRVAPGVAARATTRPRIIGRVAVGSTVRAYPGTWTASTVTPTVTTYLYVWQAGPVIVSRAATFRPSSSYRHKYLSLHVYAVRGGFLTGVAASVPVRIA